MSAPTVEDLQKYWDDLKHHDWYFDYSDDGRVWRRGADRHAALRGIATKDRAYAELFHGWAKYMFRHHDPEMSVNIEPPPRPE